MNIVDATFTVHANYNQNNDLIFGLNAGKQCISLSLCAIVYTELKSINMNLILFCDDNLYLFV